MYFLYSSTGESSFSKIIKKSASFVLALFLLLNSVGNALAQEVQTVPEPTSEIITDSAPVPSPELDSPSEPVTPPDPIPDISVPVSEESTPAVAEPTPESVVPEEEVPTLPTEPTDEEVVPIEEAIITENLSESLDPGTQTLGKYISPRVSTIDGSLSYEYPIALPPGRNGLTPDLKLIYNSANKSQHSLIGVGEYLARMLHMHQRKEKSPIVTPLSNRVSFLPVLLVQVGVLPTA